MQMISMTLTTVVHDIRHYIVNFDRLWIHQSPCKNMQYVLCAACAWMYSTLYFQCRL